MVIKIMDKLIPAFKASLFDSNLKDIVVDSLENSIDSVLNDGIFQEIPFVRTVIGVAKTAQNIHDRNLLQQTEVFIATLNSGEIDTEKVRKHKEKLDSNPDFAEKELSRVLILLNSHIDVIKSKILANFYRAYVLGELNWDQFCELSEALNRLFTIDLQLLNSLYHDSNYWVPQNQNYKVDRLVSQGFVRYKQPPATYNNMNPAPIPVITDFGKLFVTLS